MPKPHIYIKRKYNPTNIYLVNVVTLAASVCEFSTFNTLINVTFHLNINSVLLLQYNTPIIINEYDPAHTAIISVLLVNTFLLLQDTK